MPNPNTPTAKPNAKAMRRLRSRIKGHDEIMARNRGGKWARGYTRPGSMNPSKSR